MSNLTATRPAHGQRRSGKPGPADIRMSRTLNAAARDNQRAARRAEIKQQAAQHAAAVRGARYNAAAARERAFDRDLRESVSGDHGRIAAALRARAAADTPSRPIPELALGEQDHPRVLPGLVVRRPPAGPADNEAAPSPARPGKRARGRRGGRNRRRQQPQTAPAVQPVAPREPAPVMITIPAALLQNLLAAAAAGLAASDATDAPKPRQPRPAPTARRHNPAAPRRGTRSLPFAEATAAAAAILDGGDRDVALSDAAGCINRSERDTLRRTAAGMADARAIRGATRPMIAWRLSAAQRPSAQEDEASRRLGAALAAACLSLATRDELAAALSTVTAEATS
jgi:hypothetical protein